MNKKLGYWVPTGLFCALFVMGRIGHLYFAPTLGGHLMSHRRMGPRQS